MRPPIRAVKRLLAAVLLLPLLLSTGPPPPASSQTAGSHELLRSVFSGGGSPSWDGDRWSVGTMGQPSPIGIVLGRTRILYSGFWGPGHLATAAPETPSLVDQLWQNVPNPFNPATRIDYTLSTEQFVSLEIFNLQGRRIRVLVQEVLPEGPHHVMWNGRDEGGREVASGVYFYRLQTEQHRDVKRMLLLK